MPAHDLALRAVGFTAAVTGVVAALAAAFLYIQFDRAEVLLVGDVTVDLVPDGSRPAGGAVTYAAAVLAALGVRACVVTVAGPDADLSAFAGHELHVVPASTTLTFEHSYTWWGHSRRLRVTADPGVTLARSHVPPHCQRARLVILGPLTLHDVDAGSFLGYDGPMDRLKRGPGQQVVYMAQGAQRELGPRGSVLPITSPTPQLLAGLGPSVSLFLSDVETDTWSAMDVLRVAARVQRLVITQGEAGATELNATGVHKIGVVPVADVQDTNGAGDTFATAYGLALAWGMADPAGVASYAASRAVQQPQSCKPGCVGDAWAGRGRPWPLLLKLRADVLSLGPHLAAVAADVIAPAWPHMAGVWMAMRDASDAALRAWLPDLYAQPMPYTRAGDDPPAPFVNGEGSADDNMGGVAGGGKQDDDDGQGGSSTGLPGAEPDRGVALALPVAEGFVQHGGQAHSAVPHGGHMCEAPAAGLLMVGRLGLHMGQSCDSQQGSASAARPVLYAAAARGAALLSSLWRAASNSRQESGAAGAAAAAPAALATAVTPHGPVPGPRHQ